MRERRWPRVIAWVLVGLVVVAGIAVFAIAKRPATSPRYPAEAWTGQGTAVTGWLTEVDQGSAMCWTLTQRGIFDPDFVLGLVLPDGYRSFAPALIDRGSGDPVGFISTTSLWAAAPIVTSLTQVSAVVQLAQGSDWLDDAAAEWDKYCGELAKVNAVVVVKPDSLAVTE